MTDVADKVGIGRGPVRQGIRRLADHGALRFIERSYSGHLVELRLPAEVRAACRKTETSAQSKGQASPTSRSWISW